jgi:LysM repeat protein
VEGGTSEDRPLGGPPPPPDPVVEPDGSQLIGDSDPQPQEAVGPAVPGTIEDAALTPIAEQPHVPDITATSNAQAPPDQPSDEEANGAALGSEPDVDRWQTDSESDPDAVAEYDTATMEPPVAPWAVEPQQAASAAASGTSSAIGPPPPPPVDAATSLVATCPYLRSPDGTWRSAVAERDQRCWGKAPPLALAPLTQERLCRTPAHIRCEIFVAAQAARTDALARDRLSSDQLDGRFGVRVRPTPLILDRAPALRPSSLAPALTTGGDTRRWIAAAAVIAAGLVVLVVLAAAFGGKSGGAPASPSGQVALATSTPVASGTPGSGSSVAGESPAVSTSPQKTAVPSATAPSESTGPSGTPRVARTYKVQPNDTLASIAQKFGVTPRQILSVNDLGDPPRLLYGQTINIPAPSQ